MNGKDGCKVGNYKCVLRNLTIGSCNLDLSFLRSFQNFWDLQPYPGPGCLLSFHDWM